MPVGRESGALCQTIVHGLEDILIVRWTVRCERSAFSVRLVEVELISRRIIVACAAFLPFGCYAVRSIYAKGGIKSVGVQIGEN